MICRLVTESLAPHRDLHTEISIEKRRSVVHNPAWVQLNSGFQARASVALRAGDLAVIRTGIAHALRTVEPGQAIEFSIARFDPLIFTDSRWRSREGKRADMNFCN